MYKAFKPVVFALLAVSTTFLIGCDDEKDPLVVPDSYGDAAFSDNTTAQAASGQQLALLVTEVKKGRTGSTLNNSTLTALYTSGDPSLKSLNTTYYASRLEGTSGWINEVAKASGGVYAPTTGEGGTYGGFLFDENGLELEQMIEKGQYGSVFYNHAANLLSAELDIKTADQVLAIFGSNPTFPSSNDATKHTRPDKFMAVYAARRDKNDGNGFYSILKYNFIKLQTAIKAGDDYKKEQQEAIAAIKENWEKVNAATAINYSFDVISKLSATSPTDAQKAAALHAYAECVGFIHGWKTIPQQHKIITDAQIDELLILLNAPATGTPTSYRFVTDPLNELPKLQQAITKLKEIYGFTESQLEDFKKNWVAEQSR